MKLPLPDRVAGVFYPDTAGVLHTSDPDQMKLDLNSVATIRDLRVVDMATGEITEVVR